MSAQQKALFSVPEPISGFSGMVESLATLEGVTGLFGAFSDFPDVADFLDGEKLDLSNKAQVKRIEAGYSEWSLSA
ncbi:hypothetical protein GCM10023116_43320 [Kistimonas scapharcae]|uniref:Uncharacterized protein n=1 Tax=Kistimonas scapharcae TaxID=1036133 RepID=A0ABP8V719_9GAMM